MIKIKRFIFLLLGLIFFSIINAENCQYTKEVFNGTEAKSLPFHYYGYSQWKEVEVTLSPDWNKPMKIYNPNPTNINLTITVDYATWGQNWCENKIYTRKYTYLIPADSIFEAPFENLGLLYCNQIKYIGPYDIIYHDSDFASGRIISINKTKTICLGKNDGESCSLNSECGSGNCVVGQCSKDTFCYNNHCNCAQNQVQCTDNLRCVEKNSIPLDVKPKCDLTEECVSGYINTTTNLCSKSPTQLMEEKIIIEKELNQQKEQNKLLDEQNKTKNKIMWIIFFIILIISLGIIYYYKFRTKELDYLLVEKKFDTKMKELDEKEKKLVHEENKLNQWKKGLEQDKTITAIERKQSEKEIKLAYDALEVERDKIKLEQTKINENNEKTLIQKFKEELDSRYPGWEYNEKGYPKFKSGESIHSRIYKTNYQEKYGKTVHLSGREIHHIDANKLNSNFYNLIDLSIEEHKKIPHSVIQTSDWVGGLNLILHKLNKKIEDLPLHIQEEYKKRTKNKD